MEKKGKPAAVKAAQSIPKEIPPVEAAEMEWRCLTCSLTGRPTSSVYMSMLRHQCTGEKELKLVDKETGGILANSLNDAISQGLVIKEKKDDDEKPELASSASSGRTLQLNLDNCTITLPVTVPVEDIVLFKSLNIPDEEGNTLNTLFHAEHPVKDWNEFVHLGIQALMTLHYGRKLSLVTIDAEVGDDRR